ncbi:MAG: histidine kinase [Eubacteriales bacterium]|nr:histidine kinase [Eubacteriales bacterium]
MKKLQTIIFQWNYLLTFLLFLLVAVGLVAFSLNVFIDVLGEARIDLLKQVAERSKIINKAATSLADTIYNNTTVDLLNIDDSDDPMITQKVDQIVSDFNFYFDSIDLELSALILMRDGFQYASNNELTSDIQEVKSNYWYVDNFYNNKIEFWIMRFGDTENRSNVMLSYGKVIRDSDGVYQGVILINSSERTFFKVYSDIINQGNSVYILDQEGYAISHQTKDLIGSQLTYMPAFFKQYGYSSYRMDFARQMLITNYHDYETQWTMVQESDFSLVFGRYYPVLIVLAAVLFLFLFIGFATSLAISRIVSKPLKLLAEKLGRVSTAQFEKVEEQQAFSEVHTFSQVYNEMVDKIQELFIRVKQEEELKRKHELDFLQLQINPHFLHNTLFSIKCLVEMNQNTRAAKMLSSFMHLLRSPIASENELIPIQKELENLTHYIELMSYRYDGIHLETFVEEGLESSLIPRLLLQPIVENSIFHGLKDDGSELRIDVFVFSHQEDITIKIKDDGLGISREDQSAVWAESGRRTRVNKSIGLKNVRDRIRQLYGEGYDLTLHSNKGEGTEVEMTIRKQQATEETP